MRRSLAPRYLYRMASRIVVETFVPAPPEAVCAALLDPQTHGRTSSGAERVVSGNSPLALGDEVTFEATHFGIRQRLTARITRLEPPFAFEDTMVRGFFRSLWHRHEFHVQPPGTRMIDIMVFESPLGGLFDRLVLAPYLRRFLVKRGVALTWDLVPPGSRKRVGTPDTSSGRS